MGDILAIIKTVKHQKQLTDSFIRHGFDAIFAKSNQQIEEAMNNEVIDLIILDFTIASDEGFRFCERIREESDWDEVPIIGIVDDLTNVDMCFKVGATDVIDKSYHEQALMAKIKAYMGLKKAHKELAASRMELHRLNTECDSANKRIELVSVQDSLTNLYSRKFAMEQLEIAISRFDRAGVGFSIILCDIDHFKDVNEKYGSTVGDEVLMGISQMLKYHSRVQDIVARWGGEEFMMILPDTSLEGAVIYADRARERMEKKSFFDGETEFKVTMTFGVACYTRVMPLNMIISLADDAMFLGKNNGRNQVVKSDI